MIEQTTPALGLQLPHPANELAADVVRLRAALNALDTIVSQKFGAAETAAAIAAVVDSAPGALDTLNEIAAALGDDPQFATTVLNAIAAVRADSMPVDRQASATVLGGIKIGAGLSIDENGVASVPSAAAGTQTFIEVTITPTSDGQLSFAVPAGYVPLLIEVYLNGVLLINGDDYTATDGTNLLLSFGANTTDTLLVRKWSRFESTDYYTRAEVDTQVPAKVVKPFEYDDRAQLRTTTGHLALVEGLGLFLHVAGSTEPDDDESCFATATGCWLLQAAHWDLVDSWQAPDDAVRDEYYEDEPLRFAASFAAKVITGTATCAITSVAPTSSASFTGTVTGAAPGDRVIATPPGQLGDTTVSTGQLGYHAWVSAANTVTVILTNASASAANTNPAIRTAWPVTVIKS